MRYTERMQDKFFAPNGAYDFDKDTFYNRVYRAVCCIPLGKVATYGQIARLAGNPRAARVVGYALHVNPAPGRILCHRVVNASGGLTRAFAFGGIHRQAELLQAEGVQIGADMHVDMERYAWQA